VILIAIPIAFAALPTPIIPIYNTTSMKLGIVYIVETAALVELEDTHVDLILGVMYYGEPDLIMIYHTGKLLQTV
jgi:hypothetical protein